MTKDLNSSYWSDRWKQGDTGWDTGEITPPLKTYFDKLTDKNLSILIPGCGSGYEGSYLWEKGFRNLWMLDISPLPLEKFAEVNSDFLVNQLICGNFFEVNQQFDLVVEQTFFCALHPDLRKAYVRKMSELLKPGGKLAGLLFGVIFEKEGPPFGGVEAEYRELFADYFNIEKMEVCKTSIGPRQGNELFFEMRKTS